MSLPPPIPVNKGLRPAFDFDWVHFPFEGLSGAQIREVGLSSGRNLPHWACQGRTYFVTFRVARSLGKPLTASLADLVERALFYGYYERYWLVGYSIMPDHVHLLISPRNGWKLKKILASIKRYTARLCNQELGSNGSFWQQESFDHIVRNYEHLRKFLRYVHRNPVVDGMVDHPADYAWSSLVTVYQKGWLRELHADRGLPELADPRFCDGKAI